MRIYFRLWLIFFTIFISISFAFADPVIRFAELDLNSIPVPADSLNFDRLAEVAIQSRNSTVQSRLEDLARSYVSEHRIQEAIWTLKRAGDDREASELESVLRKHLEESPLVSSFENPTGIEKSQIVELGGQICAVFKRKTMTTFNSPEKEVFAYEVSNRSGLDLVPMTIFRKFDQIEGSLQVFIRDAKMGEKSLVSLRKYPKNLGALYILDYLLENKDRNQTNYLFYGMQHLVAIDHGATYRTDPLYQSINILPLSTFPFDFTRIPKKGVSLSKLADFGLEIPYIDWKPMAEKEVVDRLLERIQIVITPHPSLKEKFLKTRQKWRRSFAPVFPKNPFSLESIQDFLHQ